MKIKHFTEILLLCICELIFFSSNYLSADEYVLDSTDIAVIRREPLTNVSTAFDSINNVWIVAGVRFDDYTPGAFSWEDTYNVYIEVYDGLGPSSRLLCRYQIPQIYNSDEDYLVRNTYRGLYREEPRPIRTSGPYRQIEFDPTDPGITSITYPSLKLVYNQYTQTCLLVIEKRFSGPITYGSVALCYMFRYDAYNREVQGWNEPRLLSRVEYGDATERPREIHNIDIDVADELEYALVSLTLTKGGRRVWGERVESLRRAEVYLIPMWLSGAQEYHYNLPSRLMLINYPGQFTPDMENRELLFVSGALKKFDSPNPHGNIRIWLLYTYEVPVYPINSLRRYQLRIDQHYTLNSGANRTTGWDRFAHETNSSFYPYTPPVIRFIPGIDRYSNLPVISFAYTQRREIDDRDYSSYPYGVRVISFSDYSLDNINILTSIPRPNSVFRNRLIGRRELGDALYSLMPKMKITDNNCIITFQEYWQGTNSVSIYKKVIPLSGCESGSLTSRIASIESGDIPFDGVVNDNEIIDNSSILMYYWNTSSQNRYMPIRFAWVSLSDIYIPFVGLYNYASFDSDSDGLPDEQEEMIMTNPYKSDTDGDSMSDKDEYYKYHTNPCKQDGDMKKHNGKLLQKETLAR